MRPDDLARLRRALELGGLGETPISGADKRLLRNWSPGNGSSSAPPEADPEAVEVYGRTLREALTWLDSLDNVSVGARGEIGPICLESDSLRAYRD